MFRMTGKLLITNIGNEYLYQLAEMSYNEIMGSELLSARMKPYLSEIEQAMDDFSKSFQRLKRNHYTPIIAQKHRERTNLLTLLRRCINAARIRTFNPVKAEAAIQLKKRMKDHRFWVYDNISHSDTTLLIHLILSKMKDEAFAQLVRNTGIEGEINDLRMVQEEYEYLTLQRISNKVKTRVLPQKKARRKLIEAVLDLLSLINIYALHEPEVFSGLARYIAQLIKETNAQTRARVTRAKTRKEKQQLAAEQDVTDLNEDKGGEVSDEEEVIGNQNSQDTLISDNHEP